MSDVVKEKMDGGLPRDYNSCLDLLHTISMSTFMLGHLDVGELAGQWKDVLELKGRQLRHKRLGRRSVQYEGHSIELVTFMDSDQAVYHEVGSDSDDTGSRRGRKGRAARGRDSDVEKPARKTTTSSSTAATAARRKKAESANTNSGLVVRLQVVKTEREEGEEEEYSFQSIISTNTAPMPRKRGRKANTAAGTAATAAENEFMVKRGSRRVKKTHYDVYFDLTSEIQKVNYETAIQRNPLRAQGEWYCCVCFGDEESPENPYVCCKRCGCVVHRYCYGVETVPSNPADWLCDYCASVEMNQLPWKGDQLVGEGMNGKWSEKVELSEWHVVRNRLVHCATTQVVLTNKRLVVAGSMRCVQYGLLKFVLVMKCICGR